LPSGELREPISPIAAVQGNDAVLAGVYYYHHLQVVSTDQRSLADGAEIYVVHLALEGCMGWLWEGERGGMHGMLDGKDLLIPPYILRSKECGDANAPGSCTNTSRRTDQSIRF
jgi:hypothetical protein